MDLDRNLLLAYSLGLIDGKRPNMNTNNRLFTLDDILIKMNQPPTTLEERKSFLDSLVSEVDMGMMLAGINRESQRRTVREHKRNEHK